MTKSLAEQIADAIAGKDSTTTVQVASSETLKTKSASGM